MSEYHNREAFQERMAQRHSRPTPVEPFKVFWHVACLNNWQDVVTEQLRLMHHVGIREVVSAALGTRQEINELRALAKTHQVDLDVQFASSNLSLCEGPTLELVHAWAKAYPTGGVLYHHTKGVSKPGDRHTIQWRRIMAAHVVARWRENLKKLQQADILGVSWMESPDFPHFCGNFWLARCDWLIHLQDIQTYRRRHPGMSFAGQSWQDRMYAETWLGSEPWHHVESLCCRNATFWTGPHVFAIDDKVKGFKWDTEAVRI